MSSVINKASTDWLLIKSKINSTISELHTKMEAHLPVDDYHSCCGQIAALRALVDYAEPRAAPETHEDDYGISDPQ